MLDEVADLPLHMQVKLLRVIQEKAVMPVGARGEVPVDVRILSATHQPLKPLVEAGKFRSDLYFRLRVVELNLPPLLFEGDCLSSMEEIVKKEAVSHDGKVMGISRTAAMAMNENNRKNTRKVLASSFA